MRRRQAVRPMSFCSTDTNPCTALVPTIAWPLGRGVMTRKPSFPVHMQKGSTSSILSGSAGGQADLKK